MDFNAVTVDRFDRAAKKLCAIKNGGILSTLAGELTASVDFTPADNELMASLGMVPWSKGFSIAAVAGQYSSAELINASTAAAPWLVVVTAAWFCPGATSTLYLSAQQGAAGGLAIAPSSVVHRDTRLWGAAGLLPITVVEFRAGTVAGVPPVYATIITDLLSLGNTPCNLLPTEPVYLGPLSSIAIQGSTANSAGVVTFTGYARPLDLGELVP